MRLELSTVPLELTGTVVGPGPQSWSRSHQEMKVPLGSRKPWARRMVGKVEKCEVQEKRV